MKNTSFYVHRKHLKTNFWLNYFLFKIVKTKINKCVKLTTLVIKNKTKQLSQVTIGPVYFLT